MKIAVFLLLCVLAHDASSQDYFIVNDKDTTHCKIADISFASQGHLKKLEYTENGKTVELTKEQLGTVTTFCIDTIIIDRTPLKADKPDSYVRFDGRAVDGKLKVYLSRPGYSASLGGPVGIYRFYLKMPDGTFYDITNKKSMSTYIIPFLKKCAEFTSAYSGDYSTAEEPFMEMIRLYNSVCG